MGNGERKPAHIATVKYRRLQTMIKKTMEISKLCNVSLNLIVKHKRMSNKFTEHFTDDCVKIDTLRHRILADQQNNLPDGQRMKVTSVNLTDKFRNEDQTGEESAQEDEVMSCQEKEQEEQVADKPNEIWKEQELDDQLQHHESDIKKVGMQISAIKKGSKLSKYTEEPPVQPARELASKKAQNILKNPSFKFVNRKSSTKVAISGTKFEKKNDFVECHSMKQVEKFVGKSDENGQNIFADPYLSDSKSTVFDNGNKKDTQVLVNEKNGSCHQILPMISQVPTLKHGLADTDAVDSAKKMTLRTELSQIFNFKI